MKDKVIKALAKEREALEKDMKGLLSKLTDSVDETRYWLNKMSHLVLSEGADDETLEILRDMMVMMNTILFRKINRMEKKLAKAEKE